MRDMTCWHHPLSMLAAYTGIRIYYSRTKRNAEHSSRCCGLSWNSPAKWFEIDGFESADPCTAASNTFGKPPPWPLSILYRWISRRENHEKPIYTKTLRLRKSWLQQPEVPDRETLSWRTTNAPSIGSWYYGSSPLRDLQISSVRLTTWI